jgi:preprotein translocase subunit SecB
MSEAKKAVFDFANYEVVEFSYKQPAEPMDGIAVEFDPSGVYSKSKSTFIINLGFKASYEDKIATKPIEVLSLTLKATFSFEKETQLKDIPQYFYRNSLGIIFPYLRSFVSTMTFQANLRPPMLLPILNLTEIEQPFRDNIKEVE